MPPEARANVRRAMAKSGLREIPLGLEPGGTTIIHASDWEAPGARTEAAAPFGTRRLAPPVANVAKERAS